MTGQILWQGTALYNEVQISLAAVPSGIYMIVVEGAGNERVVQRLEVVH